MSLKKRINNSIKYVIGLTGQKMAVRLRYLHVFHRLPDLKHPKTFNEKINAYKFYTNYNFERYADKVLVKDYIKDKIGDQYLIKTLYAGPSLPPIDERNWSMPYAIKMNHCCGWNIFVRNEGERNWPLIEKKLAIWKKKVFGYDTGEPHYAKIPPQVLVEEFLTEDGCTSPADFKLFVMNGKVQFIQVDVDREFDHKECFYDANWQLLPFTVGNPEPSDLTMPRPENLQELVRLAETIGADFPFVRVDFYNFAGQIYFGELTFFPSAGFTPFYPDHFDRHYGDTLTLPNI